MSAFTARPAVGRPVFALARRPVVVGHLLMMMFVRNLRDLLRKLIPLISHDQASFFRAILMKKRDFAPLCPQHLSWLRAILMRFDELLYDDESEIVGAIRTIGLVLRDGEFMQHLARTVSSFIVGRERCDASDVIVRAIRERFEIGPMLVEHICDGMFRDISSSDSISGYGISDDGVITHSEVSGVSVDSELPVGRAWFVMWNSPLGPDSICLISDAEQHRVIAKRILANSLAAAAVGILQRAEGLPDAIRDFLVWARSDYDSVEYRDWLMELHKMCVEFGLARIPEIIMASIEIEVPVDFIYDPQHVESLVNELVPFEQVRDWLPNNIVHHSLVHFDRLAMTSRVVYTTLGRAPHAVLTRDRLCELVARL